MPGPMKLLGQSPLGHREQDLDVVRGLAILLAMGWHLNGAPTGIGVIDAVRWPGTTFGWAGVDLFFVLSGLLVGRLIFREIENTDHFDRRRFLVRRIFKLWPVLYVFLIAQLLLGDNAWNTYFFQTLLHVQNYADTSHKHLWSLAVEEHFYLAAAFLLPFAVRRKWSSRALLCALLGVVVVEPIARTVGYAAGEPYVDLQWLTHFRVDGLALGLALAVLQVYHAPVFDRLVSMKALWAAITAAGLVWLILVPKYSLLGSTIGYTVTAVTSVAVMLGIYRSRIAATLRKPLSVVAVLGIFSYSIYIWHIAAASAYEKLAAVLKVEVPEWADLGLRYLSAIAVSIVMVRMVEWPALQLRNRLFPTQSTVRKPEQISARIDEPGAA